MLPTVKTIMRTGCDIDTAKKIRLLFEGKLNPSEVSNNCAKWVGSCYNEPMKYEQILCAVDDLLGNHGMEFLRCHNGHNYTYSNTGDTYAVTVIRDHYSLRWLVTSWGDLVEKYGAD